LQQKGPRGRTKQETRKRKEEASNNKQEGGGRSRQ